MAKGYDQLFDLVERTFSVEEITPEKILDKFYRGNFGKIKDGKDKSGKQRFTDSQATRQGQSKWFNLAERLAEGREINDEINIESAKEFPDFDNLRNLRNRAKSLNIHSKIVSNRAQVQMDEVSKRLQEKRKEDKLSKEKEEKEVLRQEKELLKEQEIIEEEKAEKADNQLTREISKIESATSIITLDRISRRLQNLDVDISEAKALLEGQRASIEEQEDEINPDF